MLNNHTPTTEIHAVPAGFDFTNAEVLEYGVPIVEFARLRATAPVWWNHQPIGTSGFQDGDCWVITKHADIKAISRDHSLWSATPLSVAQSCTTVRFWHPPPR